MYLHLGQTTGIPEENVIGIFDLEATTAPNNGGTKSFLAAEQKGGRVTAVSELLPKSFTVCVQPDGRSQVYLSHLAPSTLRARVERGLDLTEEEI